MRILITGGTGFLGSHLCKMLHDQSHDVTILTRDTNRSKQYNNVSYINNLDNTSIFYDIIINLAGESLANKRWNKKVKEQITKSRISITTSVINYIEKVEQKPKLFISGSAIGYYGHCYKTIFTENSAPNNQDSFSYQLCNSWEKTALSAKEYGVRTCIIRTGIVLDKNQGALAKMLPSFKLGVGAILAPGNQWMSWVHIEDFIQSINYLISNDNLEGIFNITAPFPVSNKDFSQKLATTIQRPCFFTIPTIASKIIFGEMAEELLISGQNVYPKRLLECGYNFRFPEIKLALEDLFI